MKRAWTALAWGLALLTVSAGSGFAQVSAPGRGAGLVDAARSADEAWSVVATHAPSEPEQQRKRPDVSDEESLSEAELYARASHSARRFSERFRDDARAGQARKLEAVYALHAGQLGGAGYRQAAAALGAAYRANKTNSSKDRFDVALLMEGFALAESLGGRRFIDDGIRYEKMADSLYAEFGGTDEVHGLYTSIVRTTDVSTANRVATKLLTRKQVPEWARGAAQTTLDRRKLIGQPLGLVLRTIGGDAIDLSAAHAEPTVIFLWSVADGLASVSGMTERIKAKTTVQSRWLYVGLGGDAPVSDRSMAGSPFAASHCFVQPHFGNPITNFLKVDQAPYAFVLNRAGRVVGYGFPENVAALLDSANR